MTKLVYKGSPTGEWDPARDEILLPEMPKYKEKANLILAHEIAHREHTYPEGFRSPLGVLAEECTAWRDAVSKLLPEEIDLDFINSTLGTYVQEVMGYYGRGSEQLDEASHMRSRLMVYARKRKYA